MKKLIAIIVALYFTAPCSAVSIDLSALSSSNTRQLVASGKHIEKSEKSEVEIGGQYVKTQGREDTYDFGVDNLYKFDYFRLNSDYRFYQDRSTFSGALGYGIGGVTLTAGFRQDIPTDSHRQTYAKLGAIARWNIYPVLISAKSEVLRGEGEYRLDYRAEGKIQFDRFYVAVKAEKQKDIFLQALGLGFSF